MKLTEERLEKIREIERREPNLSMRELLRHIDALNAEIATAREEALDEAAVLLETKHHAEHGLVECDTERKEGCTCHVAEEAEAIRAMKGKG